MNIHITSGTGTGPTPLAAFDAALQSCGIANYNLLYLSSVLPPNSAIIEHKGGIPTDTIVGDWGDRLYVVMAEERQAADQTEAWAGIGWVRDGATGKGLFVEHHADSEKSVRSDITDSLTALMRTRDVNFGPIHMHVVGVKSQGQPVCAMVVAAFQTSDWKNTATLLPRNNALQSVA